MRHEIQWEREKKNGGRILRPQLLGGWYDCLLLFCGTLFCLMSAYRQLHELLEGMDGLVLPEHAQVYVLSATAVLALCYGSGLFRRMWMRLLPLLPMGIAFWRYYSAHRLQTEDGILYLLRMYVVEIGRYYHRSIMFPLGLKEEAPAALLFWLLLCFLGLFVLAAAVNRMELMLILPLAMLVAGIAVGKMPGWQSVLPMFIGALVLRMYRTSIPERSSARLAQLVATLAICILTGVVLSGLTDDVLARHDEMMVRQLALEDAMLALPVWDLFTQDGVVTNDAPRDNGKEILSISLSDAPTENVYLKTYAADHYENGRWSTSEDAFAQAVSEQEMTVQEAGEKIWNLSREDGEKILAPTDGRDAIGNIAMALPKEYDYTITCRYFGKTAPLPYVSRLPEELTMDGDTAAEKPWTKRSYSGNLVMSGSRRYGLSDYLSNYYWTEMWTSQISISDPEGKTDVGKSWYADFVSEQYTYVPKNIAVEPELDVYLKLLGWGSVSQIRAYFISLQKENSVSTTNIFRLGYVPIVQSVLQATGTYSRDLDPLPAGADPIDYFLHTSGEGYCVHFASAATLMLQAMGIPARYASGYVVFPDDFKKAAEGYTAVVTDARAHAWVEVYLDGFGWVPFEVTPGFSDGDASGGQAADTDKAAGQKEQTKTEASDDDEEKPKKEESTLDETGDVKENRNDVPEKMSDACEGGLNTTLLGKTILWWLYILMGSFAVYFAICLLADGMRLYDRKQEQRIRQELADGHYRAAILGINRRMYRMLLVRELLRGRKLRDDPGYRRALGRLSACHEAAVDVERYMMLVRQAYFSEHEMRAEDAWIIFEIYQKCKLRRKERVEITNGTDIFRIDI